MYENIRIEGNHRKTEVQVISEISTLPTLKMGKWNLRKNMYDALSKL